MKRFWDKVDKSGDCWEWTGLSLPKGYGRISVDGKDKLTHRFSYEMEYGEIPSGMCVCHKCDNPSCVRPDHLFIGTRQDNQSDMARKQRSTIGERNPRAVLCTTDIYLIRALAETQTQYAIADWIGVAQGQVSDIINRKAWAHL